MNEILVLPPSQQFFKVRFMLSHGILVHILDLLKIKSDMCMSFNEEV